MNAREIAKTKMYNSFETFMNDSASIFAGNIAIIANRAEYTIKLALVNNLATTLSIDNTVYSKEKLQAKTNMAYLASDLAGFAQVCLNKLGKTLEASQMHISSTDYSHLSDPEAKALAQSTHDLLSASAADLSPDYVTAADITDLQTKIDTFNSIQGSSSSVHVGTPEQRKNFKAAVYAIDAIIADIRLLARKYRDTNPDFYNLLIAQSTIPAVNVHHTTLSLIIKSKTDNSTIVGATGTLSNSIKTGETDTNGFMTIEQVRQGNATLTVKAKGCSDYISMINLISGHDNHFDILM